MAPPSVDNGKVKKDITKLPWRCAHHIRVIYTVNSMLLCLGYGCLSTSPPPLSLRYVVVLAYSQSSSRRHRSYPSSPTVSRSFHGTGIYPSTQTARAAEPTAGNSVDLNQVVNLPESYTMVYSRAYIRDERKSKVSSC